MMGVFSAVAPSKFCLGSGLEIMVGGRQVHTLSGHSKRVVDVAFSPDGDRVATGSEDNHVKIWDTATGARVSSLVGLRGV